MNFSVLFIVIIIRNYAKAIYIVYENFDYLHALLNSLAELGLSNRLTIFIQKTNSSSSYSYFK